MLQGNVRVCNHPNESCAAGQVLLCAMAFGSQGACTHRHVAVHLGLQMSDNCSTRMGADLQLH